TAGRTIVPHAGTGKAEKPRRVALGDTSGSTRPDRIRKHVVKEAVAGRQVAQLAAVNDILAHPERSKVQKAVSLRAILEGASPDDVKAIRRLLEGEVHTSPRTDTTAIDPNEQLATDWRSGAYPYKNLLSRHAYEAEKYRLQVELLKLQ